MHKVALLTLALVAIVGVALAAAPYIVISLPSPGEWPPTGIGVGKVAAIQIENALPDTGTVIVSRISASGAVTNTLLTRTVASGVFSDDVGTGTNIWIMAGDRLLRSGTVTNACRCRLILSGN